jgi:hypothetical protein
VKPGDDLVPGQLASRVGVDDGLDGGGLVWGEHGPHATAVFFGADDDDRDR